MSDYLLSMSVGPVQDFISSARRTRDLWYGSWLLSEISKAAANQLKIQGAELIFPAVIDQDDLEKNSDFNATNKILAVIPASLSPKEAFNQAKQAAENRFEEEAEAVYEQIKAYVDADLWQTQVSDFLEIYGAWVLNNGIESTNAVEQLLAGRKALREFKQNEADYGLFKSSLDGLRESVFRKNSLSKREFSRFKIAENEHLDAMGCIKRLGQGTKNYPSITRIAVDPWVRRVASFTSSSQIEVFNAIKEVAGKTEGYPQLKMPQYSLFPYDGTICYESRLAEIFEEKEQQRKFEKILAKLPSPSPYMSVLVADGDKMGAAINSLTSFAEFKELSLALSQFAQEVRSIVADNNGSLIYAGGDDLLALVPLDKCLNTARVLYDRFAHIVGRKVKSEPPTLSVGIAICHFMEPLGDILARGRVAEQAAKDNNRDSLALYLYKRSGGAPLKFCAKWNINPDKYLNSWFELFASDQVPSKAAYELFELVEFYSLSKSEWPLEAFIADAKRVLERKEIASSAKAKVDELLFKGCSSLQEIKTNLEMMLCAEHMVEMLYESERR